MIESLKKGDRVLTRGGIYANIFNFQGKNIVILEVSKDVHINIDRSYIVAKIDKKKK